MWQHLRNILKEVRAPAPHDCLGLDDNVLETLGFDSLDIANLIIELQAGFHIQVEFDQVQGLLTLRTLGAFILAHQKT